MVASNSVATFASSPLSARLVSLSQPRPHRPWFGSSCVHISTLDLFILGREIRKKHSGEWTSGDMERFAGEPTCGPEFSLISSAQFGDWFDSGGRSTTGDIFFLIFYFILKTLKFLI